ncbi:glycosyltransferase family 10 domain-containing protein [Arcobacter sp. F2176]|uniref:glycosyltransferase family 10 domain-containing protein n=1 Tax=Arcobacter sp. F2176 TaxID=2044511 RepID=UPI00100BEA56|nr:glycosyltransferase family 10 [Arcobacter sp. F2176]RXJ79197.1 hypothetical protein CRU95_14950 [Arcobacter sp. F2176]
MKAIAICSNIPVFWNNKVLDKEHCKKYFGASWFPIFADLVKELNYDVLSGDIALKMINENKIDATNILIIQELNSKHGKELFKLGAKAFILMAAESPLFSYFFYDNLNRISRPFMFKALFDGSFKIINQKIDNNKNSQFYFPSYSLKDISYNKDWNSRKFIIMIAANKGGFSPIPKDAIKNKIIWIIHRIYKVISNSFKTAQKNELHSKRLKFIKYFAKKNVLKLYGTNWKEFERFEKKDREELKEIILKLNPKFIDNKILTLSEYKFAICFENISMEGYITEKIIHCFISGIIPLYLGATNIEKYIPKNCYIDLRDFNDIEKLEKYLLTLDELKAKEYINNGKEFLSSEEGKKYSYESFASKIVEKVEEYSVYNK